MITLTKVSYIHEADIICMQLEEAGIKSIIADQGMAQTNALYSNAIGGIRIQIHENDLEKAKEILFEVEPVDTGIFKCPNCSSDDIEYERNSKRMAFISLFLINMPFTRAKHKCRCKSCGHTWKENPNQQVDPIVKTPADKVEAQGTQGHP